MRLLLTTTISAAAAEEATPAANPASPANPAEPMWVNKVEPIFNRSCFKCHGEAKKKGGLDLRTPASISAGGTDGSVVMPGKPSDSPLYQRLQPGSTGRCPRRRSRSLSVDEVSLDPRVDYEAAEHPGRPPARHRKDRLERQGPHVDGDGHAGEVAVAGGDECIRGD